MTKPTKWHLLPAKTHSLGIRPVWSESSRLTLRKLGSLATHWAHSEDSDLTGRMPRLIWVFAGRTCNFAGFVMCWLNWQIRVRLHVYRTVNKYINTGVTGCLPGGIGTGYIVNSYIVFTLRLPIQDIFTTKTKGMLSFCNVTRKGTTTVSSRAYAKGKGLENTR